LGIVSRYKQLTQSKRKFLFELKCMDDEHNFLSGVEFEAIVRSLNEGRYLTSEANWMNEVFKRHKETYKRLKNKS